jgi:putative ABC transport system permease protein
LVLAIIGVYGVISYSVAQQMHDIGVRMALGAQAKDIVRRILRHGMLLAIIGVSIGALGALGLTRFLRSMLFEIEPSDLVTLVCVAVSLIAATLAACYIPARRAAKTDPIMALRHE